MVWGIFSVLDMEKENMKSAGTIQSPEKEFEILEHDTRNVAVTFWNYLQKNSRDTFLDADVKDATKAILKFLNQDVVGKKIVILEEEKLRTANAVAIFLKRKRSLTKTDKQNQIIAQVKKIYKYFNNPFWRHSLMIRQSRKYLDHHLRRITPEIIQGLTVNVEKLNTYFNGTVWDVKVLETDKTLKQMAISLGYTQFGVCEKHHQPLTKDETGDIFCNYTSCGTGKCPFEASKAHGKEVDFLSKLEALFEKMGILGNQEKDRNAS